MSYQIRRLRLLFAELKQLKLEENQLNFIYTKNTLNTFD